jgi:hypothetical protein
MGIPGTRVPRGIVVLAVAMVGPSAALAQATPPFDAAIDIQTFEHAIGPKTFITVADGDVGAREQLAVDALVTFLTRPFEIYNVDQGMLAGTRTTVIRSMTAAQLTASYGVSDRLQLGANLPIVFAMQGDGLMPETGGPAPDGLSVTGLGDLIVEAKYRLLRRGALRASALGGVSLPSSVGSGGSQFIGDDLPTVRAKLAAHVDAGRFALGASAGVILRKPRTIYDSTIGQQLAWGVAAAARVTQRFSLIAEGYGRAGLPGFALDASPLEVEGGLRIYATDEVAVVIGAGAGVLEGIGSPASRVFVSLGYAPDVRDSDGDGTPNGRDRCPHDPEDKDGAQDDDGCPDDDNDGDHRADAADRCPEQPEDIDGFDDDDGCPELDNDGDKIADLQDKCPLDKEDGGAPFPTDGCPAGKRQVDPEVAAEATPEVTPKVTPKVTPEVAIDASDACADLDSDGDGVSGAQDRCPLELETVNGVSDDDGCPDTGGAQVVRLAGDRLSIDRMPALDGADLSRGGQIIVDQLALVMRANAEVTRWLIAIALPSAADAQRLGQALQARLIAQGVPADRIELLTAAGPAKIGGVVRDRSAASTCPAGNATPTAKPPRKSAPKRRR